MSNWAELLKFFIIATIILIFYGIYLSVVWKLSERHVQKMLDEIKDGPDDEYVWVKLYESGRIF